MISLLDEHMTGDASQSSVCTEDAELADTFITNDERDSESTKADSANVNTTNDHKGRQKWKARPKPTVRAQPQPPAPCKYPLRLRRTFKRDGGM